MQLGEIETLRHAEENAAGPDMPAHLSPLPLAQAPQQCDDKDLLYAN